MPDIIDILKKWWKLVLMLLLVALSATFLFTFLSPKKYLAVSTAVPASSFANDPSRVFNENIQALYSSLGTPDDLDLVVGTGKLDTVYLAVCDELKLQDHYKVKETGDAARMKIATLVKKNTQVVKSGYGELKVKVWDRDKEMAARLANGILDKLGVIHSDLQAASNQRTLASLKDSYQRGNAKDSLSAERMKDYERLIGEYELLVEMKPPVLITVERARVPQWPDKPWVGFTMLAVGGLALIGSILFVFFLEGRRR